MLTLTSNSGLTVRGVPITSAQCTCANNVLATSHQLYGGTIAATAMLLALIASNALHGNGTAADQAWAREFLQGAPTANLGPVYRTTGAYAEGGAMALVRDGWTNCVNVALQVASGQHDTWPSSWWAPASATHGSAPSGTTQGPTPPPPTPYSMVGPAGSYLQAEASAILTAYGSDVPKGGTAGSGGTGTKKNTTASGKSSGAGGGAAAPSQPSGYNAQFTIGGTNNPSEDVWTGINRLAQEVNWYLFSNGECLYFLDAEEMLAQETTLVIDRLSDPNGRNLHMDWSYDNTAYGYVSTHERKFKAQKQTNLVTSLSPTSCNVTYICGIDEVRGGDVVQLVNYGLADGLWIVASVRRSVFKMFSEIELVPPFAPITEQAAAGTTGSTSTSSTASAQTPATLPGGGGSGTLPSNAATYLNSSQRAFAARLQADVGLDPRVICGWVHAEEPASASGAPNGANNWLNIGAFDNGNWITGGSNVWASPITGADGTASFMLGHTVNGVTCPVKGGDTIPDIAPTAGKSINVQIAAIQNSGWAKSGYPDLASDVALFN